MKNQYLILLFLLLTYNSYSQSDTLPTNKALEISASYIGEVITNHAGGIRTGSSYQGMGNFMFEYDTRRAKLWDGGKIFLNAAHTHGGNPSALFIGDFQVVSNIEADNLTYFHEMWYSQNIGRLAITIGLQDLNVEFASSDNAKHFINSSFGVHSTIADNIIAPIFPLTALGIQFKYNIHSRLALKLIAFDGFPDDFSENNTYNLRWKFTKEDGLLNIAEVTWQPRIKERLEGKYSFGSYTHHHIKENELEDDGIWTITNYGFYVVADQNLINNGSGSVLSSFLQASISPYQKNENWYYLGLGINYTNAFFTDDRDIIGLALAHAGFANHRGNETSIELTYQYQLTDELLLQPDIQYIINPSGMGVKLKNSLATGLRFIISI